MNLLLKDPSIPDPVHDRRESLSALIDGECRSDELDALLQAESSQRHDLGLAWSSYLVVGAALRGQPGDGMPPPSVGFAATVIERLRAEHATVPVLAAPQAGGRSIVTGNAWRWTWASGLAAAALLLGWQWLVGAGSGQPELAWRPSAATERQASEQTAMPLGSGQAGVPGTAYESSPR